MTKANAASEKESFLLVQFYHGDSGDTIEAYTDLEQDFDFFVSTPAMEVEPGDLSGSLDKSRTKITLPQDAFTLSLSDGRPFSKVFVRVLEITQGLDVGVQNDQRYLHQGRVIEATRNVRGSRRVVRISSLPIKSRLDVQLGLVCENQCAWTVFNPGCGLSRASFEVAGEIDSASGLVATVTTAAVTSKADTYWRLGYLERDGARVKIRDWDATAPTQFFLEKAVPSSWIGGSGDITFVPGCDRQPDTCDTRFGNLERMVPLGNAMLTYPPLFETGQ